VSNEFGGSTSSVAVLTVITADANSYASNILADVPSGYWRLGESVGPWTIDSFGGYHGAYSNTVVLGVPGAVSNDVNTAVRFDGVGAKSDIPWSAAINTTNFTIEFWARVTNANGNYRSPVTSRGDSPTRGFIFYATPANTWEFWTGTGVGVGTWQIMTGPAVTNGQWVHIAGTYDGAVKRFYVNGLQVGAVATTFAPNTDRPMRIGAGATDLVSGNFYFPGDVDEVAFIPAALSQARIGSHYAAGAARFNNTPPTALGTTASTTQGRAVSIPTVKISWRDTDPDGDPITLLSVGATSTNGGAVSFTSSNVTYTPLGPFTGLDAFNYLITDGVGSVSTGLVYVTVTASNAVTPNVVWGPVITNSNFQVRFAGIPSYTYTVEYTDTLAPAVWTKATNVTAATTDLGAGIGIFEVVQPTGVATQRFFRTVYPAY
jgi:hypothetical protein